MAGNSQPAGGSAPNGGKQNDTRTLIYFMITNYGVLFMRCTVAGGKI